MKNFKFYRRALSFVMALGYALIPGKSLADIISYNNQNATVFGDTPAILYYITGTNPDDFAYVSYNNTVGYVYNKDVNMTNAYANNDYTEVNQDMYTITSQAYIYQTPRFDNDKILGLIPINTKVHILAKNKSGWYVVLTDDYKTGFVYAKNFDSYVNVDTFLNNTESVEPSTNTNVDTSADAMTGDVLAVKITGNNVNVRSGASTKNLIIGYCDKTDTFRLLGTEGSWYKIDYLGKTGYVRQDYVREIKVYENELSGSRMVYLKKDSYFYSDTNKTYLTTLPKYQNALVLDTVGSYLKVKVDGVIGYVEKKNTAYLTNRCIVVDLSRQTLKVFKNGSEIYRAKIISGAEDMQTPVGCYKAEFKDEDYTFDKSDIRNEYVVKIKKNYFLHPANANYGKGWQKDEYFDQAVEDAYANWAKGNGKTYPKKHGSHGCVNMMLEDIKNVFNLIKLNDNILIIGPNDLIRDNLISFVDNIPIYNTVDEMVKKLTLHA